MSSGLYFSRLIVASNQSETTRCSNTKNEGDTYVYIYVNAELFCR